MITIAANLAKKLPIPGADYSSQQASITITAEVTDLNQVGTEAQRLYALAEQAVDRQLAQGVLGSSSTSQPAVPSHHPASAGGSSSAVRPVAAGAGDQEPRRAASRPYRSAASRREPAPATDSQLRYIDRLLASTQTNQASVLEQYGVTQLRELTCKEAAGLIDTLKGAGVPA